MSIRDTIYQLIFWLTVLLSIILFQGCSSVIPSVIQADNYWIPEGTIENRPYTLVAVPQGCESATQLSDQSVDYVSQNRIHEAKILLNKALQKCPNHVDAHNNLAVILEDEGQYEQAIAHYKQALKIKKNFSEAWYGLGETYYKQGQFPLSLEAHLHACKTDPNSHKRVKELLKENRYAITEEGQILNKESLLMLYDKQRRETINGLISDCGMKDTVKGKGTFRNVTFHTGSAKLTNSAIEQIKNLAAAFNQAMPSVIKVHGHTDKQAFKGITDKTENDHLNMTLSQQRAKAVKMELIVRGIRVKLIQTRGYGSKKPLDKGNNSKAAYAKNRRVEIESMN